MSSDFAENWYTKVSNVLNTNMGVKILVRTIFAKKLMLK